MLVATTADSVDRGNVQDGKTLRQLELGTSPSATAPPDGKTNAAWVQLEKSGTSW